VRARLGTSIYELAATLVNDKAELEAVGETYVVKYDLDREDNWVSEAMVYRLDRRTEAQ
jgi:hypothetical protein